MIHAKPKLTYPNALLWLEPAEIKVVLKVLPYIYLISLWYQLSIFELELILSLSIAEQTVQIFKSNLHSSCLFQY